MLHNANILWTPTRTTGHVWSRSHVDNNLQSAMRVIVTHQLGLPLSRVAKDSQFVEELGADWLEILQIILEIEEELGIEIPDEEGEMMGCINDVLNYVAVAEAASRRS